MTLFKRLVVLVFVVCRLAAQAVSTSLLKCRIPGPVPDLRMSTCAFTNPKVAGMHINIANCFLSAMRRSSI